MPEQRDLEELIVLTAFDSCPTYNIVPKAVKAYNSAGKQCVLSPHELDFAIRTLKKKNQHSGTYLPISHHSKTDESYQLLINNRTFLMRNAEVFETTQTPTAKVFPRSARITCSHGCSEINCLDEIGDFLIIAYPQCKTVYRLDTRLKNSSLQPIYHFDEPSGVRRITHVNFLDPAHEKLLIQYGDLYVEQGEFVPVPGKGGVETVLCDMSSGEKLQLPVEGIIVHSAILTAQQTFQFRVLGTGNANCQNNTSFIIEADKKYLVDVPPTLEQMLKDNKQDISEINDVIITHAHGDHIGGLQWYLLQKINAKQKVNFYTTRHILLQSLSTIVSNWIRDNATAYVINNIDLDFGKVYSNEQIKIEIRDNNHEKDVPTIGFKFSYKGKTLGYSADCTAMQKRGLTIMAVAPKEDTLLASHSDSEQDGVIRLRAAEPMQFYRADREGSSPKWFSECDLIIHEAEDTNDPVHTDVKVLEALPDELKSKMYITHLPPGFRERYKGPLKILQEGVRYRV